jgi:excisionase family DNA binding protein
MNEPKIKRIMSPKEVAEYLAVSRMTVMRLLESGELGSIRVGAQWRITESQLKEYIRRNSTEVTCKSVNEGLRQDDIFGKEECDEGRRAIAERCRKGTK